MPHSYAIINQFHCLELLRRNVELFCRDVPGHPDWKPTRGLLDADQEAAIAAIGAPPADAPHDGDVVFRQSFPHNCAAAPNARRVCMYLTAEQGVVPPGYLVGAKSVVEASRQENLIWIAPSQWTRKALLRSGAAQEKIRLLPHGVMPDVFRAPTTQERAALRREKGLAENFVFLNIGAMTANKGLVALLKGLAAVASIRPQVRLLLKGLDQIYPSKQMLMQQAGALSPAEKALVEPRLMYLGNTLSLREMATLYHLADAYVSPYRAEGFNIPVLEAGACGLPVICTRGGPTDDFTTDDFALRVESAAEPMMEMGVRGLNLAPRIDSVIEQMARVVEDAELRQRARVAGPEFVHSNYSWNVIGERLMSILFE